MSEKITAMIEEIKGLSVLELAELVHALEDTFGVSAAAVAALRRSRSSRKSVPSPVSAWPMPRLWSKAFPPRSRKPSPRKMQKPSRPSSKLLARRSSSSKHALSSLFRNGTGIRFCAVSAKALPLVPDLFSVDKLFAFNYNVLDFAQSEVLLHAA